MEYPIQVTSTDEVELVDIEGNDDDDILKSTDLATNTPSCYGPGISTNTIDTESTLFKRRKTCKNLGSEDSSSENDFTKWWKSASEFQRPVVPTTIQECSADKIDGEGKAELNPILKSPVSVENDNALQCQIVCDEDGEVFCPPEEEIHLSFGEISKKEREKFPEFFSGQTKYSPHNYLAIRNAILKLWLERKPDHVNKVILRPMLKKYCGNVNNIGKIHRYLESVGAINFGSDLVWWKRKRRRNMTYCYRPPRSSLDTDLKLKRALEQRMSGRSRKRPGPCKHDLTMGNFVGGYTIDHANNNALIMQKEKRRETETKPSFKKYNLVKCRAFDANEDCPFDVFISAEAFMVMDVHSHLSAHEVMGLIGGCVAIGDSGKTKVHVMCAHPCKSTGSSRHCEMDSVSQSVACELIMNKSLKVVGWYHSHPTFPPQPSETDIATQVEQQSAFFAHDSPFLGVILTPYFRHQIKTEVNLVHVTYGGTPFTVPFQIDSRPPDGPGGDDQTLDLMKTIKKLIDDFVEQSVKGSAVSRLPHLLDPIVHGSSTTHLDKLMKSLSSFVASKNQPGASQDDVLHGVETMDFPSKSVEELSFSVAAPSCDIVRSPQLHDDDVNTDSCLIAQNFPSLAHNGFCTHDAELRTKDVMEIPDVSSIIEVPLGADTLNRFHMHSNWTGIFDGLKMLLLQASEHILSK